MKLKIIPENLLERIALTFNIVPTPMVDTQLAFTAARAVLAAADTGIFEAIGKSGRTCEYIAGQCKTHPVATKHLLDCLMGIGYLEWSNGQYSLKPKLYKWLLAQYPSNLIGVLRFQIIEWNWMARLEDYVRTGKPMELHAVINVEEWASYQDGMHRLSINISKEVAGKIKLPSSATKMLDIGGSHGLYSIELCKKYPSLSSTILELPGAIGSASAIAAQYGLTGRVRYQPGNALSDDLGEEQYDIIMINNLVHHFTGEENITLARKAARALKPGGIYAVGEFVRRRKPGAGGAVAATAGLYFALTSSSGTWSAEEINSWQRQAGLKIKKPINLLMLPGWKMLQGIK